MLFKRLFIIAVSIGLLAVSSAAEEVRSITVSGDSEVRVTPDEVVIVFAVQNDNLDIEVAKAENDALVARVLSAIAGHGIPSKHIQTDYFVITPKYTSGWEHTFKGFYVRKAIVVTLKKINIFDDVLTSVVEAGATHIRSIDFRTTELRKYRDQARAVAIKAAEDKARDLAAELGAKIGKPIEIQEGRYSSRFWYNNWWRWWGGRDDGLSHNVVFTDSGPDEAGDAIALGQISVKASVSVTFELE